MVAVSLDTINFSVGMASFSRSLLLQTTTCTGMSENPLKNQGTRRFMVLL